MELGTEMEKGGRVLVVDDTEANVALLKTVLNRAGYEVTCLLASGGVMHICRALEPELIILDLHMPGLDGFEILAQLRALDDNTVRTPVLVFTADLNPDSKHRALRLGASDFLTKPGDINEIQLRVSNAVRARRLYLGLERLSRELETKVWERTRSLWESQREILERLARTAEWREGESGEHACRVGELSARIALELGMPTTEVELIRLAAPLRDIGKVGIRDSILLSRGLLSDNQVATMRTHTTIGAEILRGGRSPLITLAEKIARYHHERWDGIGYPEGLAGEAIPIQARIVAVADEFDALTTGWEGRRRISVSQAIAQIVNDAGKLFDPAIVEAFLRVMTVEGLVEMEAA
ncbi:MAG TPA: HD domain-containing phosphohydrolase [Fimbriimonadaceae bacterium]|nr:HD domain-containing phosphohydrolase [Fimbriimonadaceae bacterium]